MSFAPGALVTARGREWVVLPESKEDMLVLRPLGGSEAEIAGIYLPLEKVESATFRPPNAEHLGDHTSCRLLRDAVRLGFRSSAGPFRSFAQLAVEPRPYQLVPLLMALKQDPVRLLIADDVGIGKTVEAGLIAREMLDRGEAKGLAVLCPPHLAEQWQLELRNKFHIDAELVLASTATRLEKHLGVGESLFEHYRHVVVSMDFIKSDRRRDDFLRTCPELVIVDEAHTCAFDGTTNTGRHQRHQLLKGLAKNENRHLVLVTATPHSGKEAAFRSLLALLRPEFEKVTEPTSPKEADERKRELAKHVVQRRRGDLKVYLDAQTPFPKREELDETYSLSPEYQKLFAQVLEFARETVLDAEEKTHRQRIRWWAALGLLRALASSPAAAAMTLRNRAAVADTESVEAADELGRATVLDASTDDGTESVDVIPGGQTEAGETDTSKRLLALAKEADALAGKKDTKLQKAAELLKKLVNEDSYSPIVFCRFIPTAEYVAENLRKTLRGVEVVAVTGQHAPADREERVLQLAAHKKAGKPIVLVATDCLSEGINLQDNFDAVIHYDLAWNPTRHEQREGRVDRYGQPRADGKVRVLTYYGRDNRIDGLVLDVLLKKHKSIRNALGVSVPVPTDPNKVMEAILEGLLLKKQESDNAKSQAELFPDQDVRSQREKLHREWQEAADREKLSQTVYAQYSIKVDEVARELHSMQGAIGSWLDVKRFVIETLRASHAVVGEKNGSVEISLNGTSTAIREAIGEEKSLRMRFELPVAEGVTYVQRTHPIVDRLANHVLTTALDEQAGEHIARRAGVIQTDAVEKRTTLLLVRFRFHILTKQGAAEWPLLAEDCVLLGFRGAPQNAEWIDTRAAEELLGATPKGNVVADRARDFISKVLNADGMSVIEPRLAQLAEERGRELLDAHKRVRESSKAKGVSHRVQTAGKPDLLGVFLFLPSKVS